MVTITKNKKWCKNCENYKKTNAIYCPDCKMRIRNKARTSKYKGKRY